MSNNNTSAMLSSSNFLQSIIEADLAEGTYANRKDDQGKPIPQVITRFPPEPNGYLHIGHAKSIYINFGLAQTYSGRCHLRFDDTNPEKEDQKYVDTIIDSIHWLGLGWNDGNKEHIYFASDYFDRLYEMAEYLILAGLAYVDSQNVEQIAINRGNFNSPGNNSPFRNRSPKDSLDLFRRMKIGEFDDGKHTLRARIDMASTNMNMRDPIIYRIRRVCHHRTGSNWYIYPMYDYTHPISDALENISHSICTLEFQDHRPFYDWLLSHLSNAGFLDKKVPRQYEFSRLNVTYMITSKRQLHQLVKERIVDGWDDPRMPTIVGMRRRGFTPESIRLFCERAGVTKSDGWIEIETLEHALRENLNPKVPRANAVLRPLALVIDNFPEGETIDCCAPLYPPAHIEHSKKIRQFPISKTLWIEQEDFMENPVKGYFRLFPPAFGRPGGRVRLRHGFVVECIGFEKNINNDVTTVHCIYFPESKSGTEGSSKYKVKGNIHWISKPHAVEAEVRLYDRLFDEPYPDAGGRNFRDSLNPESKKLINAYLEPGLENSKPGQHYQFERHGYFVVDFVDSLLGKPVFNQTVSLKDSWGKKKSSP